MNIQISCLPLFSLPKTICVIECLLLPLWTCVAKFARSRSMVSVDLEQWSLDVKNRRPGSCNFTVPLDTGRESRTSSKRLMCVQLRLCV